MFICRHIYLCKQLLLQINSCLSSNDVEWCRCSPQSLSVGQSGGLRREIGFLYLSHAMLVLAGLSVCSMREFACILAKWFWPTVMSLSLTYGNPEASCNKQVDTYFGKRSTSLTKEFWTLYFGDNSFRNSYGRNNPIFEYWSYTLCRFVELLRDLDPTFCWLISLSGEIFGCSVLKLPQNVLRKSSYCQMWYLRILCQDSTKEGRRIETEQALPLLQFGTWRILWL